MDDAAEAQALIDDLLALLDAGFITAVQDGGTVRYEAVDRATTGQRGAQPVNTGMRP
jgi:hypothetical protein